MSKKSKKKDSRQMEFHLPMSSQVASRANRSASQANKQEQVTTDISGLRCFESSKSLPRGGLLEKMSKALLTSKTAWSSRLCALTWKERDTKSGRSIFQLQASAPRIRRERIWIVAHRKESMVNPDDIRFEQHHEAEEETSWWRTSTTFEPTGDVVNPNNDGSPAPTQPRSSTQTSNDNEEGQNKTRESEGTSGRERQ